VTSLLTLRHYFADTPFVQLPQQTLIVVPDSHNMRRDGSDVRTEFEVRKVQA
jgi:hypothetical protein